MISIFPNRTVAVEVFGFALYWYGLFYVVAFWLGLVVMRRIQKYRSLELSWDNLASFAAWVAAGVLVGGRLGYVLFYEPQYYAGNIFEIFMLGRGGMSAHGGMLGAALALCLAARRYGNANVRALFDIAAVPAAFGLALGRIGNFINQELYGIETDVFWAVSVPGAEGLRHPVQLYAVMKNLLIAAACYAALRYSKTARRHPGMVGVLFLFLYSIFRFGIEFYREQEWPLTLGLTRGQVLTAALLVVSVWLFRVVKKGYIQTAWR